MTVRLDKYTVFKTDVLNEWVDTIHDADEERMPDPLDHCVVIRLKDVFAESALRSYAASVLTAVDVLRLHPGANEPELEWLVQLADYFNGAAEQASRMQKKVPTP